MGRKRLLRGSDNSPAAHCWLWIASAAWSSPDEHEFWRQPRACCWNCKFVQTHAKSVLRRRKDDVSG